MAWIEVTAMLLAGAGFLLDRTGLMMVGLVLMVVTTLAFVPLLALSRLEQREAARRVDERKAKASNGQKLELPSVPARGRLE